jgi:cell fate (sporulation/competence/biofilm development) regulator YlbF (YheA/YmcA/DUF963 family)
MRLSVPPAAVGEEMMIKTISSIGQSFMTMATQLGEELATISVISNYRATQKKLNEDDNAKEILRKLSAARKELGEKQFSGTITQEILDEYSKIQKEVENNQTIREFSLAQQENVQFLREVNLEISNLIGIDFSSLLPRNNSC